MVRIASFVWFPTLTFKMLLAMEGTKPVASLIKSYANSKKEKVACVRTSFVLQCTQLDMVVIDLLTK